MRENCLVSRLRLRHLYLPRTSGVDDQVRTLATQRL